MPLIECPECGHKISEAAGVCPQCSHPLKNHETEGAQTVHQKTKTWKRLQLAGCIAGFLALGAATLAAVSDWRQEPIGTVTIIMSWFVGLGAGTMFIIGRVGASWHHK